MTLQKVLFREALNQAMCEEMERDANVFLMGEEVGEYDGPYKVSQGMLARFGPKRVVDTPISENAFCGLGIGAAMTGLRPIVEFMSLNFSLVAFDQIVSNAAKTLYMSGGQFPVPMVMRGPGGAAAQVAAQHSNCVESYFAQVPGLKVVMPSTPYDAKGLLKTAIRDDNPVIFIENELLYGVSQEIPAEEYLIPLGQAHVRVEGSDVTLIAYSRMAHLLESGVLPELRKEGIRAELVDPRTIKPLDLEGLARSVRKTHRAVIVEEGHRFCGVGAEIADRLYSACFDDLDAPLVRVTQQENPLPYSKPLETASLPQVADVVQAVKQVLYRL
ncbi:MAG: pyruvate dehydrogenase complex E1 component subunit beta [Candidatus Lambdaproteobacteria bacterium]|nr:pyruvate dehydrogenase complex E1 component subunit beta [Candidatus Lambdaproteobacteria bacterium]